ncbi:MAG: hypothetical protein QXN56_03590 [Candidatus Hadarchaeum sp.]
MHTCAPNTDWVLFTWELRRKARGRRRFYAQLEVVLNELPSESWRKLGGSVYLVKKGCSGAIRELLRRLENPDLEWYELNVVVHQIMHTCAQSK